MFVASQRQRTLHVPCKMKFMSEKLARTPGRMMLSKLHCRTAHQRRLHRYTAYTVTPLTPLHRLHRYTVYTDTARGRVPAYQRISVPVHQRTSVPAHQRIRVTAYQRISVSAYQGFRASYQRSSVSASNISRTRLATSLAFCGPQTWCERTCAVESGIPAQAKPPAQSEHLNEHTAFTLTVGTPQYKTLFGKKCLPATLANNPFTA